MSHIWSTFKNLTSILTFFGFPVNLSFIFHIHCLGCHFISEFYDTLSHTGIDFKKFIFHCLQPDKILTGYTHLYLPPDMVYLSDLYISLYISIQCCSVIFRWGFNCTSHYLYSKCLCTYSLCASFDSYGCHITKMKHTAIILNIVPILYTYAKLNQLQFILHTLLLTINKNGISPSNEAYQPYIL